MTQRANVQQIDEYQLEGAYTDLNRLVGLHRFSGDLRLTKHHPGAAAQAGEWKTRFRGRGIDFEEVRLYQPGDDIRSIDWRVTARSQKTHTRVYREEKERPVILAADMRSPMFFGSQNCFKSVLAAALTSCLAWCSLANRDRVGGLVFGDYSHRDIRPRRSKHNVLELIRQLDAYSHLLTSPCPPRMEQPRSLSDLLETLVRICKPGTAVFIASDFHDFDESCRKRLYQLARHVEVTLFLIVDPLEEKLPARGQFWITNGVRRQRLSDSSSHGWVLSQRIEKLEQACGPLGVCLHRFSTGDHLLSGMHRLYGRRNSPMSSNQPRES
ncbi:DUF58 domain-containing protein [Motiliproteus sp. MSK22-1]|uniref:DUF58 domain-containing protein n=1 Tax=Motiliproteus sp. MSK22-1 TaxID=1897630 RepID=UPI000975D24C|nr:DUF58 domain-containing protein [Motiliproteus sp. MSK22-1]OMH33682.1 hypothetical protein BGP75_11790 [Motiliproteus sp. MSK22-1]